MSWCAYTGCFSGSGNGNREPDVISVPWLTFTYASQHGRVVAFFPPFFFLVFSVTCTQIIEEEGGQRGGEATRKHYPTAYYFLNPSSTDQCLYYKTWETKQMLDANLGSARWNSRHEVSESTRCELLIDLNKQTSTVAKNKQTGSKGETIHSRWIFTHSRRGLQCARQQDILFVLLS